MIGYYVHHHGQGHLHRAIALAHALDEPVTGLSSLPRPDAWAGPWVDLPRDDAGAAPQDVTAGGQLHWVPLGDAGLRARSAVLSAWLERDRPRLVVVDVSVEVALLVRLHGVAVVGVVLPGRRTDPPHLLGFRASSALVTFSPLPARDLLPGVPADVVRRVESLGAISRFAPTEPAPVPHTVVVLQGRGGVLTRRTAEELALLTPGWTWTVLGGDGRWVDDVSVVLREATVVVTHAGESALADTAAHRRPAVVVTGDRPFAEQRTTAAALEAPEWPAVVVPHFPDDGWPVLLERAAALDGRAWSRWYDGRAAERFAGVVARVAA